MKFFLLLVVLSATAFAQCPAREWCQITPRGSLPNSGWNNIFFSHDTGLFYLYADDRLSVSPWENAFYSYVVRKAPAPHPWTMVSSCGDSVAEIAIRGQMLCVDNKDGIRPEDTSVTLVVGGRCINGTLSNPPFPQSGTLWIDDEAMDYQGCDELTPEAHAGSCPRGSKTMRLSHLVRGQRQQAGYTAAAHHRFHALANLACPRPTLGPDRKPTTDHPPSRHPVASTTYDSRRGRIWEAWGYQENWSFQDTWYLCVSEKHASDPKEGCTAEEIRQGWHRLPLFTTGGYPPGDPESAMVYDPDDDVLINFGGTSMPRNPYLFCLSSQSTAYGCRPGNVGKWIKVEARHGNPGSRDGSRMLWDPVNHLVLVFGGKGSATLRYDSVAAYNVAKGDWCLSDTRQGIGQASAPECGRQFRRAAENPPPGVQFPAWTFDTQRSKAAFFAGGNDVYLYDAAKNEWTHVVVAGAKGPVLPELRAEQSWAYDDLHRTFVYVSAGDKPALWQLPDSALDQPVGPQPGKAEGATPPAQTQ